MPQGESLKYHKLQFMIFQHTLLLFEGMLVFLYIECGGLVA